MQTKRIVALFLAASMALSPLLADAKSSGFGGGSRGGSSFRAATPTPSPSFKSISLAKAPIASPISVAPKKSGFSTGTKIAAGTTAGVVAGATAAHAAAPTAAAPAPHSTTGNALYSANANKAAVASFNNNKAQPQATQANAGGTIAMQAPTQVAAATPSRNTTIINNYGTTAPRTVVHEHYHSGGSDNGFLWFMLGRATAPHHDTVVVQQSPTVAVVTPQGGTTVVAAQPGAVAQQAPGVVSAGTPGYSDQVAQDAQRHATQASQAADDSSSLMWHFLRAVIWASVLGLLLWGAVRGYRGWQNRKAKFAKSSNYHL